MEQPQRQSMRMVFILMVSAIFCAAATFGAINFVGDRSETPEIFPPSGPQEVFVDNLIVTLNRDPEKTIILLDEVDVPLEQPEAPPTLLEPTVQEPTALPPEPTPVPTLPPPTPIPDQVIYVDYVVKQGDSLFAIAEQQNSSIELMALNGIDSDDLVAGTLLSLPVANPAYCPSGRAYVVRDKDTVFRISQQFGTSPESIRSLNNLDEAYTIRVAQVICIAPG